MRANDGSSQVLGAVVGAGERGALFSRTALGIGKQVFMEVRAKQRADEARLRMDKQRLQVGAPPPLLPARSDRAQCGIAASSGPTKRWGRA
jgi:hypothetical protein